MLNENEQKKLDNVYAQQQPVVSNPEKRDKWKKILFVVIFLWAVGTLTKYIGGDNSSSAPVATTSTTSSDASAAKTESKADLWSAYGMACDAVRRGIGWPESAKCEISKDECSDYGDNRWLIVAYIRYNGMAKRFTAEMKYHPDMDKWQMMYEPAIMDVH